MKQNYFKGKYYKFINKDGFTFALIDGDMANGKVIQIIFPDHSYKIEDIDSIRIQNDSVSFSVMQDDLTLFGTIYLDSLNPIKKDVMGILRILPIECKHNIYSMYGNVHGIINYNKKSIPFEGGYSYIEGDEGTNFPTKYIWFNSIGNDYGITCAIAEIPFFKTTFLGSFLIIKVKNKDYVFSTLNGLKIKRITDNEIFLKKGRYRFLLNIQNGKTSPLLAPKEGKMSIYIHEAISTKTNIFFNKKRAQILKIENVNCSLERVNI